MCQLLFFVDFKCFLIAARIKGSQTSIPLHRPVDATGLWKSIVVDRVHRPQGDLALSLFYAYTCAQLVTEKVLAHYSEGLG